MENKNFDKNNPESEVANAVKLGMYGFFLYIKLMETIESSQSILDKNTLTEIKNSLEKARPMFVVEAISSGNIHGKIDKCLDVIKDINPKNKSEVKEFRALLIELFQAMKNYYESLESGSPESESLKSEPKKNESIAIMPSSSLLKKIKERYKDDIPMPTPHLGEPGEPIE